MAKGESVSLPEQDGLAVPSVGIGMVLKAQADLLKTEIEIMELRMKLEADILDAQIKLAEATKGLGAAAVALSKANLNP